ncbi:MAG: DUF1643 domain-containing protein [Phycisphaerae bacterium]
MPTEVTVACSGDATFSACGRYRYSLSRRLYEQPGGGPTVLFVMLNPSTADARRDDATVRRCIGFARAGGFAELAVVNLFALCATSPAAVRQAAAASPRLAVGRGNDGHIRRAAAGAATIICAWGVHGRLLGRGQAVLDLLLQAGHRPACLGTTAGGFPRHPLYVPASAVPAPFMPQDGRPAAAR